MILVIGAQKSGKGRYAKKLGFHKRDIIYNAHALVHKDPENAMDLVDELLKKEVVTINEVGSGVIPDDPILRAKREATGRVGAALAERATKVVRMVAGIPMVLKDETPQVQETPQIEQPQE